jgi:hypothetical protein
MIMSRLCKTLINLSFIAIGEFQKKQRWLTYHHYAP